MAFSTRTRYGLRLLLCLAKLPAGKHLQLNEIGRTEHISSGYLQQIARALRPMHIISAVRGSNGGYALNRPASEINMEEVFSYLEGNLSPVRCLNDEPCARMDRCSTVNFWKEFDSHVRSFLRSKSLQDILDSCPQCGQDDLSPIQDLSFVCPDCKPADSFPQAH